MIRKIQTKDKEEFIKLATEFYNSEAVLHPIPTEHFLRTFAEVTSGSVYADCFILEEEGRVAGYMLTAKTFSQEAGGKVIWIEEIYVRKEFRGKGIGAAAIEYIEGICSAEGYARLRLEVDYVNARARKLYERQGFSAFNYNQMVKEL